MDKNLKRVKHYLRADLKTWPTKDLCALLAHAQEGKLHFLSCCCYIGFRTADHAYKGFQAYRSHEGNTWNHYKVAKRAPGAVYLEDCFLGLGIYGSNAAKVGDELRRARLIPMILKELRDRERAAEKGEILCENSARDQRFSLA